MASHHPQAGSSPDISLYTNRGACLTAFRRVSSLPSCRVHIPALPPIPWFPGLKMLSTQALSASEERYITFLEHESTLDGNGKGSLPAFHSLAQVSRLCRGRHRSGRSPGKALACHLTGHILSKKTQSMSHIPGSKKKSTCGCASAPWIWSNAVWIRCAKTSSLFRSRPSSPSRKYWMSKAMVKGSPKARSSTTRRPGPTTSTIARGRAIANGEPVASASVGPVKPDRNEQRTRQRYLRMSKEALVERLITVERLHAQEREHWLSQQDDVLTWRLRAETAETRLKEGKKP